MFDVSNPKDVTEKHNLLLDEYWSEANYNHKAIVVSAERQLIAFPAEGKYLVFSYSKDTGFVQKAELTANSNYYNSRGLFIQNVFFVCNNQAITAYSMTNYQQLSTLTL
ncbi:hypothetical protein SDC9_188082 [bioreactor metagenome]|uniref:Uncharacterized protein n=1 Tax=bioreactor metagenome TaxID=1076179 RepID=A0A645HWI5_9ZZZZ